MRALFLVSGGLISAKIISAWMSTGNSVAGLWIGQKSLSKFLKRDLALGAIAPSWSICAMVRRHNIQVRTNPTLSDWDGVGAATKGLDADVLITAMTHQIVPDAMLRQFQGRAVNFHPALLPCYRGPHPRLGMILDGKASTYGGVTLHVLTSEIDRGPLLGFRSVPYDEEGGFIKWDVRLARAAADLVTMELQAYLTGALEPEPQLAKAGSYRKVRPDEISLSAIHTAQRAEWLCKQLGPSGWIRFGEPDIALVDRHIVERVVRNLGPRTNQAPRIKTLALEFDVADARLRVARPWLWTRFRKLIMSLLAIEGTSPRWGRDRAA